MKTTFRQFGVFALFAHVGLIVLLSAAGVHVHHEVGLQTTGPVVESHRTAACDDGELPVEHLFELLGETVLPGTFRAIVDERDQFERGDFHEFSIIALSLSLSGSEGLLPPSVTSLQNATEASSSAKTLLDASRAPPVQAV